jgi:hypothetical protein
VQVIAAQLAMHIVCFDMPTHTAGSCKMLLLFYAISNPNSKCIMQALLQAFLLVSCV